MSVVELSSNSPTNTAIKLGVCILDSSIASFSFADFDDDRSLSKLRTMLAHYSLPVAELVISKGAVSSQTFSRIKKCIGSSRVEIINSCYNFQNTVKLLLSQNYFSHKDSDESFNSHLSNLPPVLHDLVKSGDVVEDSVLSLSALGSIIHLLKRCLVDEQILSSGTFSTYFPDDDRRNNLRPSLQNKMIIDDNALRNLDVVVNSEGYIGKYGTILSLVNHCMTSSGKRCMTNLVCHPLYHKKDIEERLDAIEGLLTLDGQEMTSLRKEFGEIPDLERLLFRLCSFKSLHESSQHPQNRAVLFNENYFNKRKVDDLISLIGGFEKSFSVYLCLRNHQLKSSLLDQLLHFEEDLSNSSFTTLDEIIGFFSTFKGSFDVKNAKKEAVIIPHKGFIAEYDASLEKIERIELKLEEYLEKLKKKLTCKNLKYWGSDRSRYLIEIPTDIVSSTNFPNNFEFKSQRKGFKRYSSPKCQNLFSELVIAEESKKSALRNVFILLIKKIIYHKKILLEFVKRISMIDCLMAFSYFSSGVVTNGILTRLEIKDGYHPCLSTVKTNIVSNHISMGTSNENMFTTLLITGPNMGGKSTLMRQTAIIVILAQLGCYVPCSSCVLTPVDRIFARLGASFDHPNSGESTFYVELAETAVMIKQATPRSLILLDELGRGTATHDGLAIAFSILKFLSVRINCRTMFSTHYHFIARDLDTYGMFSH